MTTDGGFLDIVIFIIFIGVFFKGWFFITEDILTHKIFKDNPIYIFPFFVIYVGLFYSISNKLLG